MTYRQRHTPPEHSATSALNEARHTHGRRHVQRFDLGYQLECVIDHVINPDTGLVAQLNLALRKGRIDKVAKLQNLIDRAKSHAQGLGDAMAARYAEPIHVPKGAMMHTMPGHYNKPVMVRSRVAVTKPVMLAPTLRPLATAATQPRHGIQAVNAGKVWYLRKD